MPAIPFGLGSYSRGDDRLPPVRLINLFAEQAPTSETGVALLQRPGLVSHGVRSGACRGFYKQEGVFSGDLFEVFGTTLYRAGASIGTVAGSDRVEWAYTVDGFRVLAGGTIYLCDGASVVADSFPDSANCASLTAINNILVAVREDTGTVYFRVAGDTVWNGLDFFSAEREPDPAIAVRVLGDELWIFGTASIEPFYPTGNATTPFQRIDGRGIQRGCKSRDSIVQLDNSLAFVGENSIAYRIEGGPVRISNHGIEERIKASATVSSWTYTQAGHEFYVMGLASETLAYDVSTGEWHQLRLYDTDTFGQLGFFDGSTTYVGTTDLALTMDADADDDNGSVIERIFTSILPTDRPVTVDRLDVLVSPGTAPISTDPVLETRWSDDQSRTWTGWRSESLGEQGQYRKRVSIRRLGMTDSPGRVFEHRVTDQCIVRLSGVEINPALGGRSR